MIGANFRYQVLQIAGRIVKYAQLSRLADGFGYGYVSGATADGSLGQQESQQPIRFMQWFGFRSRPVVKQGEAIVVACRGGTSNAVAVAADNLAHGPTDLQEGESVMYSSGGSSIKQDIAGQIAIDAKAPADVVVNGGSKKVARVQDACVIASAGPLALWMAQVETAINILAPGSVTPLSPTFVAAPGIEISSAAGSSRFKA